MTASGSYDVTQSHSDTNSEIRRLDVQARLTWEKEARTLSWFGLKDGMSLIELGSGPGFVTESLLNLVPNSSITCLDVDASLLAHAKQYLQSKGKNHVYFVESSVINTSLANNSFDFAYARLLFQHLPDPNSATKEIWRILKPGGKLVIYDIDDEVFGIIQPPIPEFSNVVEKCGQAQSARGGNRRVGRDLWGILKAAGFSNLDLEVIASHSDKTGIEPFLHQIDPDRLLPLVKVGLMSENELKKIRASRDWFLASPKPYLLTLSLMVCGQKSSNCVAFP